MSDSINLSTQEKNLLTEILYDEKNDRAKHHQDTRPVDKLIDKTLGRITYRRKSEKVIEIFNGSSYESVSIGGIIESEHGRFKVQDIDGIKLKIKGNWYHKNEFEPAIVSQYKGKLKGIDRWKNQRIQHLPP